MTRFAFYGRVSTEDQQDPESSRAWQITRARQLIEPAGGTIVAEYFDIGQSRSLPWKRRPEAGRLLVDLARADRDFDAIVIGEPQRAFYGNQFGLTFPVFTHYAMGLWVPEVGGAVDPGSDAHDLVMSLYGGMSKGERMRIKTRVRSAMGAQALQGRFLGGRPPYGYGLADGGPHPNPGKAADGKRLHYLAPDPATAPMVQRIFTEYIAGTGFYAIAEGLTRDGVPSPSAADPARNRHRSGIAWSKAAVRAIIKNPRYTGRQVWNRQRRDEVLLDVENVALGHSSKLRWNDEADWVWSTEISHEPIIDVDTFTRAQLRIQTAGNGRAKVTQVRRHDYLLRGRMTCSLCGRRMQGSFNNGRPHYRCKLAAEYALANKVDHPKTVYVREDRIEEALDAWLAQLFEPDHIDATCRLLADVDERPEDTARLEAARRLLDDTDDRLAKLTAAIEAGSPADLLAPRMRQLQGDRQRAQEALAKAAPTTSWTPEQVRGLVLELGDIAGALSGADRKQKAQLYDELGLELVFDSERSRVSVGVSVSCTRSVSEGGLEPPRPFGH
jgi:site-specific DNA recombinase